jgi:hypothetical protein
MKRCYKCNKKVEALDIGVKLICPECRKQSDITLSEVLGVLNKIGQGTASSIKIDQTGGWVLRWIEEPFASPVRMNRGGSTIDELQTALQELKEEK